MSARRARRGFLLVEVLVSVALLGVVIYVSGSVLELILKAHAPEAPARAQSLEIALRSLRRDAAFAVTASPVREAWSEGPLVLAQAAGSVRYALSQGVLTRTETLAGGRSRTSVVGRGLTHFRFRASGNVLSLEVGVGGLERKGKRIPPVIESAWVALRGGKGGRSW